MVPFRAGENGITKIDLLQLDTEGHDYTIIRAIDFQKVKPTIICYENVNLSDEDNRSCEELLINNGYTLQRYGRAGMDTLGYLN